MNLKEKEKLKRDLLREIKLGSKALDAIGRGDNHKLEFLKSEVLEEFNADESVLTTKHRKHEKVVVRCVFVYLARAFNLATYHYLAELMNRDHSTIISAERNAENLFFNYPDLKERANRIYDEMLAY